MKMLKNTPQAVEYITADLYTVIYITHSQYSHYVVIM